MRLGVLSEADDYPVLLGTRKEYGVIEVRVRIGSRIYTYELGVNAPALKAIRQLRTRKTAFRGLNAIKRMDPNPRIVQL